LRSRLLLRGDRWLMKVNPEDGRWRSVWKSLWMFSDDRCSRSELAGRLETLVAGTKVNNYGTRSNWQSRWGTAPSNSEYLENVQLWLATWVGERDPEDNAWVPLWKKRWIEARDAEHLN